MDIYVVGLVVVVEGVLGGHEDTGMFMGPFFQEGG